jgi:Flp pilus assembly protein TadG
MAFMAVALAIVLMPVAAYAIDSATVSSSAAALQEATAMAALDAVQQLNTRDFRADGTFGVDETAARQAARDLLAKDAPAAYVAAMTVSGAEVTVATAEVIRLPFNFFPEAVVRLNARASARLAGGYDRPSSRLPLPVSNF